MKNAIKDKQAKERQKNLIGLGFVTLIFLIILKMFSEKSSTVMDVSLFYFKEMMVIFPAIVLLMGLFMVWVSKDIVLKYMGATSGLKGVIISIILGALPTGPLFVAFPLALALKNKGASITNIVVFLSAWASIKIPQELVEFQFLGLKFMMVRLALTIIFVTIMGMIIEKLNKVIG
ncbi:MAG: permease [Candidatus Marinimicrobia bacterium]|nr:permease [Candidatus Neomarinimicrobiota bacterium]